MPEACKACRDAVNDTNLVVNPLTRPAIVRRTRRKRVHLNVRLPEGLASRMLDYAEKNEMTITEVVTLAVRTFFGTQPQGEDEEG